MDRANLSIDAISVQFQSDSALFGELAKKLTFTLEPPQTAVWEYQIQHLRQLAKDLPGAVRRNGQSVPWEAAKQQRDYIQA
jgi:hypothetical protein